MMQIPGADCQDYMVPVRSVHQAAMIHGRAEIGRDVDIGPRTKVWQFASVIRGARVGADCSIASCAIVDGATVGDATIVSHSAFIDPGVIIGNGVFIGPLVALCNDAWPRVDKVGFDMAALLTGEFVTTRIEDGASLGARVVVLPGLTIGRDAMVAAGAVVMQSVPANTLYKRDGSMCLIDPARVTQRMRRAS